MLKGWGTERSTAPFRLAAVSVDLDGIELYRGIHGVPQRSAAPLASCPVYEKAVPRLSAWAAGESVPLTWFVVGRDLRQAIACERLREVVRRGDEIGNHSMDHHYDLTRLSPAIQRSQVHSAQQRIESVLGVRPRGFRAPGYAVDNALLEIVERSGFLYDSSVFPCPVYWAAKALAVLGYRSIGRRTHAILGSPRVLRAPTVPYRIGNPYWTRGGGLLEIPIQVTPSLRLPFIGTSLALSSPWMLRRLTNALIGGALVNLELHGIDALDRDDGIADLASVQPDVRIDHEDKLLNLTRVVRMLRQSGYTFTTLAAAAQRWADEVGIDR